MLKQTSIRIACTRLGLEPWVRQLRSMWVRRTLALRSETVQLLQLTRTATKVTPERWEFHRDFPQSLQPSAEIVGLPYIRLQSFRFTSFWFYNFWWLYNSIVIILASNGALNRPVTNNKGGTAHFYGVTEEQTFEQDPVNTMQCSPRSMTAFLCMAVGQSRSVLGG